MIDYYETKSQPITRVMVWRAYHKVKANHGSAGIDRMNWDDLDKNLRSERYKLWNRLSSGSYFPLPVKQVAIAKKDGGVRNLGIPTLLDRIAQEVVKAHLEPIVEPLFRTVPMVIVQDAILDRIIPKAHRIELKGKSRRKNLNQLP